MKIGIYGGTFDPPHLGHMGAARAAMELLGLDRLLLIPAKLPPHKALPAESAPPEHRLEMAARMADGFGRFERVEALDIEIRRDGTSYTVDTLAALREAYPQDELILLMGADMFLTVQTWRAPERIFELAGVAGFARAEGDDAEALAAQCIRLREDYGARAQIIELPEPLAISSTALRGMLARGDAAARDYLWPQVYGYILRHGLYGTRADLKQLDDDDLRAVVFSMVRARRMGHIAGTESEAVKLAKRWGANERSAARAAILHDCTKYLDTDEQLALCDKYGIETDEMERTESKLLHAKTGAAIAQNLFGEPEAICAAIHWHTTAKADMTVLEKIIYLADYIEPTRTFDGVESLRALAYENLDEAVALGCEYSVEEMAQRGKRLHKNTREALEYLRSQSLRR